MNPIDALALVLFVSAVVMLIGGIVLRLREA